MRDGFSVLVFDMAHTGEPDGERVIDGFATVEAARAYAEARVRDSVEELRQPGQTPEYLRSLWHVYGEDCAVLGDGWRGREQLDLYIAVPATASEREWSKLTPRRKRFHAVVLVSDGPRDDPAAQSVWAGGFLSRYLRPTPEDLLALYRDDAQAAFVRQGRPGTEPKSLMVGHLYELFDPPAPPADKPLKRWRVTVRFVCNDVKFGGSAAGVFAWPTIPRGSVLGAMERVLIGDCMAMRGDGPSFADYCDVLKSSVEETTDAPDYPVSSA
jgi:hypothetical protein